MKINSAEIIKTGNTEKHDIKQMLENARVNVADEQLEATQAEEDARSLELELLQAQAAHERKEQAESRGKETSEKISEFSG